jgi:hypothetical protein
MFICETLGCWGGLVAHNAPDDGSLLVCGLCGQPMTASEQ